MQMTFWGEEPGVVMQESPEDEGVYLVEVRAVCPRCGRQTKRYKVEADRRHRKLRKLCGECVRLLD